MSGIILYIWAQSGDPQRVCAMFAKLLQLWYDTLGHMEYILPDSSVHWDSQAKEWVGCLLSSRILQSGIEPSLACLLHLWWVLYHYHCLGRLRGKERSMHCKCKQYSVSCKHNFLVQFTHHFKIYAWMKYIHTEGPLLPVWWKDGKPLDSIAIPEKLLHRLGLSRLKLSRPHLIMRILD